MLKKLMGSRSDSTSAILPEKEEIETVSTRSAPGAYAVSRASTKSTRTLIGEKITITGDIRGSEDLMIDGILNGRIELENHQLSIGPKGRVQAEILAESVIIGGTLTGNIRAPGKVTITREADFHGEIKARSLVVEDGAYLKAVIELERPEAAPAVAAATVAEGAEGPIPVTDDGNEHIEDSSPFFSKKFDSGQD